MLWLWPVVPLASVLWAFPRLCTAISTLSLLLGLPRSRTTRKFAGLAALVFDISHHTLELDDTRRSVLWALSALTTLVLYSCKLGPPKLFVGTDAKTREVLERCPRLLRGLTPPFWCFNAHLQFVPWLLHNEVVVGF